MGITLIAPAFQDDLLVDLASAFLRQSGLRLGATDDTAPFPCILGIGGVQGSHALRRNPDPRPDVLAMPNALIADR